MKRWQFCETNPEQVADLAEQLHLPILVCRVLAARGFAVPGTALKMIAQEEQLYDPYLLPDMNKAVNRIRKAVEQGEKIAVYGDYDCDGVTATVLLYNYLETIGANVHYYIPDRYREGYGLNQGSIRMLAEEQVELIITVDNGISAMEEIKLANELGMEVIVTDHHQPREILPEAFAVINPQREDSAYPFRKLAGVGVAFKLICALEEDDGELLLDQYADLVTVGTVADIVELSDENRTIVRRGLQVLENTENCGLQQILEVSGLAEKKLTAQSVAFGIAPRVNAAGRIGSVDTAVDLFVTSDNDYAVELAGMLDRLNTRRKQMEEEIAKDIVSQLESNPHIANQRILIVSGENWHHGIIGIVASKMVERFGKPCVLLSVEGEEARGSARSVEGFSIIDAITGCSSCLDKFGGHTQAAGVSLKKDNITQFTHELLEYANTTCETMPVAGLAIDAAASAEELTIENVESLSVLEPFGAGNPVPLFIIRGAVVDGVYAIGGGKHIRLKLTQKGKSIFAVYFGMTVEDFPYRQGDLVDIAAELDSNEYNGEKRVSVRIRDMRILGIDQEEIFKGEDLYNRALLGQSLSPEELDQVFITRDDMAVVYRLLKKENGYSYGDEMLYSRLIRGQLTFGKMKLALDVLEELGLIKRIISAGKRKIVLCPAQQKVNMDDSLILQRVKSLEKVMVNSK